MLVGDLEKLVRILLRIAFYLTPIIYSVSNVFDTESIPDWVKAVYSCNPMVGIINLYQAVALPARSSSAGGSWGSLQSVRS